MNRWGSYGQQDWQRQNFPAMAGNQLMQPMGPQMSGPLPPMQMQAPAMSGQLPPMQTPALNMMTGGNQPPMQQMQMQQWRQGMQGGPQLGNQWMRPQFQRQ